MSRLEEHLHRDGVCVVRGFGGVGKSTLLALYGHQRQGQLLVWWLPCEDANILVAALEHLATGVGIDVQAVKQSAGADAASYRRDLVRLVYSKLGERQQGALLVLDNADDAELLSAFLHARPHNTKLAVTTRHATLFADHFPQLALDVFDQAEALEFVHARFAAHGRKTSDENAAALVAEVGLVP